ncbi:uncharacterized protein EV420DRAFT_203169 [Desarmillaria tabescens]|uniref:Uncharacterized protein n=1 Tax=Armillaria tabescens TaxID=1929756 RepID=A0AA39J741_ARMTA|nr:uncharacterized protein EV420DRAFT_203169 [Desarmillaria tabescens]KAK0437273.1 hypothetical protein EV420DRAFT_203169 [Desarmillaria tabescens]
MSESSKESLSLHSFRSATVHTGYISVWKKVADLYTMFKGSRELDLDFHGLLKDTSTPSPLIAPQGGSLVKLAVEGYYRSLLQSIIQTGTYPFSVNNLKSFSIKMFDPDEVNDLKEFLDFPLPSLEHLSVSYYSIESERFSYPTLNLPPNLRFLSMSIIIRGPCSISNSLRWCAKNLESARHVSLETFTINASLLDSESTEVYPNVLQFWSEFAVMLSESDFGSIRNVSLIFRPMKPEGRSVPGLELYKSAVEREMSLLITRGLVTIS